MQMSRGYKGSRSEAPDPDLHTFPQNSIDTNISSLPNFTWRLEAFDQLKDNSFVNHKDLCRLVTRTGARHFVLLESIYVSAAYRLGIVKLGILAGKK